jgi:hypothetical protein
LIARAGRTAGWPSDVQPQTEIIVHAKHLLLASALVVSFNASASDPDESKPMMGLDLKKQGAWSPTWDADAKVAKWENDKYMTSIVIRAVSDKLDTIDDLKAAAPMMMQLGQDIKKVAEGPKTTKQGWWAVVDGDGTSDLIYVQKHGSKQLVCSASVKKGNIPKADAMKACESIKVK